MSEQYVESGSGSGSGGGGLTPAQSAILATVPNKQDKDLTAITGNLAIFDASGNTIDAGTSLADLSLGRARSGNWDAATNTPTLPSLPTTPTYKQGEYYDVTVAGTFNGIDFTVGDRIVIGFDKATSLLMWELDDFGKAASQIAYDNTASGATSTNLQDSTDEAFARIVTVENRPVGNSGEGKRYFISTPTTLGIYSATEIFTESPTTITKTFTTTYQTVFEAETQALNITAIPSGGWNTDISFTHTNDKDFTAKVSFYNGATLLGEIESVVLAGNEKIVLSKTFPTFAFTSGNKLKFKLEAKSDHNGNISVFTNDGTNDLHIHTPVLIDVVNSAVQNELDLKQNNIISVANQAAMLALTGKIVGDIVIREDDNNYLYRLTALPASSLSNWEVLGKDTPPIGETVEDIITTNEVITSKVNGLYAFTGTPNGGFPAGVAQGDIAQKTASVWTVAYTFINAPASIYSKSDGQTYDKKVNSSNVNSWVAKPKPTYYEIGSDKEFSTINSAFAQFVTDGVAVGTGQLYDSEINERAIFPTNAQNFLLKGEGYVTRNNNLVNNLEILGHRFTLQKCQPNVNVSLANVARTVTTTLNSKTIVITGAGQTTTGFVKYQKITGTGIPAMSYIDTIVDSTTFTISQNATASGTNIATTIQPKAPVVIDSSGTITENGVANIKRGKHAFDDISFSTPGASVVDIFDIGNWADFRNNNFAGKEINLYTTSTTFVYITFTSCQSGVINIYSPFIVVTKAYSPSVSIKTIINQAAIVDFDKATPIAYSIIRQRSFGEAFDIPLGAMIVNDDIGETLQNMKCTTAYTVAYNPTTGTPIDKTKYQVQTDNAKANDNAVVHLTGAETIANLKTFSTAPLLSSLTASQRLELDASKNIISVAKNTADNKNYSTTATDIKINGIQSVGTLDAVSRADHIHPIDTTREASANKVSAFTATPNNTNFPTEKLVKDSLDLKQNITDNTLNTTSKTIVGGINELKTSIDGKVVDAINDGVTSTAPSQNAVFDALALKANQSTTYTKTETDTALALKQNIARRTKVFTNQATNFTISLADIDNFEAFEFTQTTAGIIITLSTPIANIKKDIYFKNLHASTQTINLVDTGTPIAVGKMSIASYNGTGWNIVAGGSGGFSVTANTVATILDLNTVTATGITNYSALTSLTNGPTGIVPIAGTLIAVENYFATNGVGQNLLLNDSKYFRSYINSVWSSWQLIATVDTTPNSNIIDGLATPPTSPSNGDAYVMLASPTGAWSAFAQGTIATYNLSTTSWVNTTPANGTAITFSNPVNLNSINSYYVAGQTYKYNSIWGSPIITGLLWQLFISSSQFQPYNNQSISLALASNLVTATCLENHNLAVGSSVTISASPNTAFNETVTVTAIVSPVVFKYAKTLANTTTTGTLKATTQLLPTGCTSILMPSSISQDMVIKVANGSYQTSSAPISATNDSSIYKLTIAELNIVKPKNSNLLTANATATWYPFNDSRYQVITHTLGATVQRLKLLKKLQTGFVLGNHTDRGSNTATNRQCGLMLVIEVINSTQALVFDGSGKIQLPYVISSIYPNLTIANINLVGGDLFLNSTGDLVKTDLRPTDGDAIVVGEFINNNELDYRQQIVPITPNIITPIVQQVEGNKKQYVLTSGKKTGANNSIVSIGTTNIANDSLAWDTIGIPMQGKFGGATQTLLSSASLIKKLATQIPVFGGTVVNPNLDVAIANINTQGSQNYIFAINPLGIIFAIPSPIATPNSKFVDAIGDISVLTAGQIGFELNPLKPYRHNGTAIELYDFILMGEVTWNGTVFSNVLNYHFNRRTQIDITGVTTSLNSNYSCNIGASYKIVKAVYNNISGTLDAVTMPNGSSGYDAFNSASDTITGLYRATSIVMLNNNTFKVRTGNHFLAHLPGNNQAFAGGTLSLTIEGIY